MTTAPLLFAMALLLGCSAFFAGSEVALFSLRRWRVDRYRQKGRGAQIVVADLLRDPRKLLITILIGNETVNIAIANAGSEVRRQLEASLPEGYRLAMRLGAALLTSLLLVLFGELLPKNLALGSPERWALAVARPLALFHRAMALPRAVLSGIVESFAGKGHEGVLSQEDFESLLSEGERTGVLNSRERELIGSVFEMSDRTVRQLMTPRSDLQALPLAASLDDGVAFVVRHKFSRVPVFESSIDEIAGIVYANDLLASRYGIRTPESLRALMRPALFVPESKKARDLLRELQDASVQLAVVLDEYGVTVGVVTLDDLLSEIVGEIADSFDTKVAYFTELHPGVYRVLARMDLDAFTARTGAVMEAPGCDTVGGYVLTLMGRIPARGDKVETERFRFTVLGLAGRQVMTLLIHDKRVPAASGSNAG